MATAQETLHVLYVVVVRVIEISYRLNFAFKKLQLFAVLTATMEASVLLQIYVSVPLDGLALHVQLVY